LDEFLQRRLEFLEANVVLLADAENPLDVLNSIFVRELQTQRPDTRRFHLA
jgi:hypothetical protein